MLLKILMIYLAALTYAFIAAAELAVFYPFVTLYGLAAGSIILALNAFWLRRIGIRAILLTVLFGLPIVIASRAMFDSLLKIVLNLLAVQAILYGVVKARNRTQLITIGIASIIVAFILYVMVAGKNM